MLSTPVQSPPVSREAGASRGAEAGGPALGECSILVVDDDRIHRRILCGILRHEGWRVGEAASGEEALTRYAGAPPDLVLLAVRLPGLSGLDTCRQLKATYGEACAPVIFLTACDSSEDVVAGFNAGASDYVPKPWRAREVVARVRSHLQNQVMAARQKQLVNQLSAANAAKDRFVGMVAHDLRSPLAGIRGLLEFLGESPLASDQQEMVLLVHDATQSMLRLVEDLLDFAHLESGRCILAPERSNLGDLLSERARLMEAAAARKNITIVVPDDPSDPMAWFDPTKLGRVVDNLLSNAVKFSPLGSVVTVVRIAGAGQCGFAVRDQGPGIPAHEHHLLFRDFARLSVRPTGGEKSTGLGLSIARRLIEAHHGSIAAENLPGGGCEFCVRLPVVT